MVRAMPGAASPRRAKRRAVIIGGSMSGLFSAAFLRQIGWDVDVYERSSVELVGRGAGITGHPELMEALEASGAGTKELGVEVPKRIAIDREGRVTDERPLRQILTSWDRLHDCCARPSILPTTTSARTRPRRPGGRRPCPFSGNVERADLWSAATASVQACVPKWRRRCSRSMPAITSGAARRTKPISRR
jgi:2-polyprenyl-6-methoxyphenol hydroxylase-like FAD-dependent oxidoreductase